MGISGRIARFFIRSPLTPLIALVSLLLGLWAVIVTPKEEEPQIDVTMANIMIPWPGATPADVESRVTVPAEQVLARMEGVEHVHAISLEHQAILTVQFKVGVARNDALVRLHDTLDSQQHRFRTEPGVGEPLLKPMGIDDVPIVTFTLSTKDPERAAYDLERIAHSLESELKRIPGTRDVTTIGGPGRITDIALDPDRLRAVHLTALEVAAALQSASAALPAGGLTTDNQRTSVRAGEFLRTRRDVEQLVVGVFDGKPVYLSSIADVHDGAAQPRHHVWIGYGSAHPMHAGTESPAVTLAVTKKSGENAVDIARALIDRVDTLRNVLVPEGVEVTVSRDYGATANEKAMKLIQKLMFATLSVVILVLLALGRREALIVGSAVLLTLAVTLFASWAWGFTLNRVSLFALIFSIGILVDDAIVVVENIHRHRLLEPDTPLSILIPRAVDEVGGPTILATFTVIAALLPMAFVTGLMGPYMSPIPINASLGMLLSLMIAFVVTPWLALRWAGPIDISHEQRPTSLSGLFGKAIRPFLDTANGRRRRHGLYAVLLLGIAATIALVPLKSVVMKMLPFDNKSEFQVVIDLPPGTALETTAAATQDLCAVIAADSDVMHYQAYVGSSSPINFNGLVRQYYLRSDSSQADIQVNLVDKQHRSAPSHVIAQRVRPALETVATRWNARVKIVEVPPGPPVMSPLVAEIYGPDETGRQSVAKMVEAQFQATPDITAIDHSMTRYTQDTQLLIDRNKAMLLGVHADNIAKTLNIALQGMDVTTLMTEDSLTPVPLRMSLPDRQKARLDDALKLTLRGSNGQLVMLTELVTVRSQPREQARYRKDLLPVTYVVGDMAGSTDSPLYGLLSIRKGLQSLAVPNGLSLTEHFIAPPEDPWRGYHIKWDGEWQITYETFRDMGAAYGLGLVLIYLLVVAQFKSYGMPLIIMAPIPLTLIGIMPGHALMGAHFTATSMIGMIALAGIIVRNSILLVDFIDKQQSEGIALADAVVNAACTRAKPIILTGVAAMTGAFFILDDPIFNGLAISLIYGISISTLLTLVVIPVAYFAWAKRQQKADMYIRQDSAT